MDLHRGLEAFAVLAVVGLAGFHLFGTANQTLLNADELTHLQVATMSLPEVVENSRYHAHPPLHFLVLHGWTELWGSSVAKAKYLSVILLLCAAALGYLWARSLVGLPGAFLFLALMFPHRLGFSVALEVRSYALMLVLILAGLYCLERLGRASTRHRGGWIFLFGFANLLAVLSHYSGALAVLLIGVWALLRFDRAHNPLRRPGVVMGIVLPIAVACLMYRYYTGRIKELIAVCNTYVSAKYLGCPECTLPGLFTDARNHLSTVLITTTVLLGAAILVRLRFAFRGKIPSVTEEQRRITFAMWATPAAGLVVAVLLSSMNRYPLTFGRHGSYLLPFVMMIPLALVSRIASPRFAPALSMAIVIGLAVLVPRQAENWRSYNHRFQAETARDRLKQIVSQVPQNGVVLIPHWDYVPIAHSYSGDRYDHRGTIVKGRVLLSTQMWAPGARGLCHWSQVLRNLGKARMWYVRQWGAGPLPASLPNRAWLSDTLALHEIDLSALKSKPCAHTDEFAALLEKDCQSSLPPRLFRGICQPLRTVRR